MFPQDSIFNSNELLSMRALLCETPTKEPMELTVISNFHHPRPHKGIELKTFLS